MAGEAAFEPAPRAVQEFLRELVARGEVSAAVGLCGGRRGVAWATAVGERVPGAPVRAHDRFDLASLTKPYAATLALVLDRQGRFPLDEQIGERFPNASRPLTSRSWRDLLRHRAGFVPWWPLYRKLRDPARAFQRLAHEDALGAAVGTYSDLGYIYWTLAVERVLGRSMLGLLRTEVLRPLAMRQTHGSGRVRGVVSCGLDNAVEVELAAALGVRVSRRPGPPLGRAQDGNTRFLGGVPGHAGLWSSAEDVWRLGREWLAPTGIVDRHVVAAVVGDRAPLALGWRRRRRSGSGGLALSPSSFGHPGFTGTSLWIDPEAGRIYVLLAHRTRTDVDIDRHRRRFHRLADEA